jgi:hypothetical protein
MHIWLKTASLVCDGDFAELFELVSQLLCLYPDYVSYYLILPQSMRPTAADRERLAAGIELCEHLAQAVREAQRSVLDRHVGSLKDQEIKFFEGMQAQRKLEQVRACWW